MINFHKIGIIGCGNVGSTIAYTLMQSGLINELVLIDADNDRAEGEAMDIAHGVPFTKAVDVYAGSYQDIMDAGIVIIAAGSNQHPGDTRLSLLEQNYSVMQKIAPRLTPTFFSGIILVVTNPVDVLTYFVQELTRQPHNRVIGSGTVLDSARLKYEIGNFINIDPRNVHAFIIGEHGDSEFPIFSMANVSGTPIEMFCPGFSGSEVMDELELIADDVKDSANRIISKKNATFYGIGMAVRRIVEAIIKDEKSILPVSARLNGEFDIKDICLSVPCIVGRSGIISKLEYPLSKQEEKMLKKSADILKDSVEEMKERFTE